MAFLKDHDILTTRDYMEPALRARIGRFRFDLGRMANEPHANPIRRGPLLYDIFVTRTEGHPTAWEEMML